MIPGTHTVFHTIYIYEQKFNTVQTVTANNLIGPVEGKFCMSVCTCVLVFYNIQMYNQYMIGTSFLYTNEQSMCVFIAMQVLGSTFTFSSKSPSTHKIFNNNPLINNIIQVITFWEPASQHFLCYYCIFNVLVHSNSCILSSIVTCLINREIKTNVTPHRVV